MAVNAEQLAYAGKSAIDYFLKNDPIDQVNIAHPLFDFLVSKKKMYTGGLQYVVEQLRKSNDSNFQSYQGSGQVTYNNKRTLEQAKYTYASFHDGFGIDEDDLTRNGITFNADDRGATPTADERVNLTNIMQENMETLKLGMQEGIDLVLHRDGSQDAEAVPGLDALVSITPSSGTVGTIAASNAYWQNFADLTLGTTVSEFFDALEAGWRACMLYGGSVPDKILAGSDFIDAYRNAAKDSTNLQVVVNANGGNKSGNTVDGGIGNGTKTGIYFKGVEIEWDPVFELLDAQDAPTVTWSSRCYFLNSRHLTLRPIQNHWMVSRKPPRVYDRYVMYNAVTTKFALTTNKRNAHAVFALG